MRRGFLLAALATCAAAPAHAQDGPPWAGVWEGRVGDLPVRACLDAWPESPGRGSYYYLRHLEAIGLSERPDAGHWIERAPGSDVEATWQFSETSPARLRGTWRQGRRSLAFALAPVPWEDANEDGPCGSMAFLGPRLQGGRVTSAEATLSVSGGPQFAVIRHTYEPPAPLVDDAFVETFTVAERHPGDPAINRALRAVLPQGASDDPLHQCLAGSLSAFGTDGWYNHTLAPITLTPAFVGIEETWSTSCGGAHPNYSTSFRTYDRTSGEEVDLFGWLGEARIDGEDSTIPAALRSLVFARWPAFDGDAACAELFGDAEYWSLGLSLAGLIFRPDFPHAATPCEESITLDWETLAPFLNAEGRARVNRLRGR